ncbi:DUF3861 domain-containing protein [Ferrimonas balearica]|uniref:DUF3861 domain-containing protein n=1 Tax=Ferrimonas balearica TaxID=44012 RepID=UPI001C990CB9|nr:DUF3861 domain-containing protein [Ferrimonas balearica]MBY5991396.1 DUF3861 domain-containing protein [Ferrimonas balearica]
MKGHLYRITVEHLEDPKGNPQSRPALSFQVRNHDDLYKIVDALSGKLPMEKDDATAFAIGVKLFGEAQLKYRRLPLFKGFKPQFTEFMSALKAAVKSSPQA